MGKFANCTSCQGKGKLQCRQCVCKRCNETGNIDAPCSKCGRGEVTCIHCSGDGKVVVKKGFFSDKLGPCRACKGSGKTKCSRAQGRAMSSRPARYALGRVDNRNARRVVDLGRTVARHAREPGSWLASGSNPFRQCQRTSRSLSMKVGSGKSHPSGKRTNQRGWRYPGFAAKPRRSDFADEMRRRNRGAYDEAGSLADGSDLVRHANQLAEQVRDSEGTILELKNEIAAIHEVLNAKWANA